VIRQITNAIHLEIINHSKKTQTFGIDKRNALFLKPRKQGQSLDLLCYSEMPKSKNENR